MAAKQDFLKAIWDQPHDDAPRLVYADWLEEQGDAARAEFIRLQCDYARTEKYEDHWYDLGIRIEKLWKKHKKTWQAELPESVRKYRFERGFVTPPRRDITAAKFMSMTDEDLAAAPLWRFAFTNKGTGLVEACQHRNAARLQGIYYHDGMSSTEIDGVFESQYLRNLTCVSLSGPSTKNHTVQLMCDRAADMPYLTDLELSATRLTDAGLKVLADSPLMPQLRDLSVDHNNLTVTGAETLAASSATANLRNLQIGTSVDDQKTRNANDTRLLTTVMNAQHWKMLNQFLFNIYHAADPIEALLVSKPCFQLRHATFECQAFQPGHYARLMEWSGLQFVRDLSLWSCDMTPEIARILVASPHLKALRRINFTEYARAGKSEAEKLLRDRFGNIVETTLK